MAIACSVCVAVLICMALFPKEFRTTDLSPVIFLLGLVLFGVLYTISPGSFSTLFSNGMGVKLAVTVGMLSLFAFSGTTTFKILKNMPASAYKSLAPAAISVGVLVLLALTAIL